MDRPVQVLFVDDDLVTAQSFAELLENRSGFVAGACSTVADAVSIFNSNPVAVVVLDQRMPERSGTDLFRDLLRIRPSVKAVMLSGEAGRQDVADALAIGYVADVRKDALEGLVPAVQKAYAKFMSEMTGRIEQDVFLGARGLRFPFVPRVEYWMNYFEELPEPYVPDSDWSLIVQVNAGQTIEIQKTICVSRELIVESSVEAGLESAGAFGAKAIRPVEASIKAYARSATKRAIKNNYSNSTTIKETYSLPAEPADPTIAAVKARGFYVGPEFVRFRMGIRRRFMPYNEEGYFWLDGSLHTGRYLTKQVDILTDGQRIERLTNIL